MAPAARQNVASGGGGGGDECDLSGEFDARCRISVHYASTAAMDGNGNGKREEEEAESCGGIYCSRSHLGILFDRRRGP